MMNTDGAPPGAQASPGKRGKGAGDPLALPPVSIGMRRFSTVILVLLATAVAAFVLINPFSISFLPNLFDGEGGNGSTAVTASTGSEATLYQCPMHADVLEPEPGNCPICQMELMPVKTGQVSSTAASAPEETAKAASGEREILYWYSPMDPTFISDKPGLSPMGMKLVPKYKDEVGAEEGIIEIEPALVQNIGVVSEAVHRTDLNRIIRTVGILDFDADNVYWINMKYSGWIEKVYINYVGQEIKKGEPLFEIYSPELVTTQEEYLRALDYRESLAGSTRSEVLRQAEALLESARQRLAYWDISPAQISELEPSRRVQRTLEITSPVDGVVVEVMDEALEGMFVTPGMNLYKLADLRSIWVHVDAYESDLPWVRVGQPAEVQLSYFPGENFRGRVLFLQPELDKKTRTVKVCVEIPNPRLRLKPGMYANVRIEGKGLRNVVAVPDSAILRSGERNVVFLDLGEGRFLGRDVELGMAGENNLVEIRKGLTGGERVVVQAQFMLDSESRVQEAIRKFITQRGGAGSSAPQTSTIPQTSSSNQPNPSPTH